MYKSNVRELTVTELSVALRLNVEAQFSYVSVRGEISGLSKPSSGHIYLNLKDDTNLLSTICWKTMARKLSFELENGLEVVCKGRISTYGAQSKYQLIVDSIEPAGIGSLMALIEKRKEKLTKEGLFDISRKKTLPYIPNIIGVISSPTGAVIRDILQRLCQRFPRYVILWPVAVQGEYAASQVVSAIQGFNRLKKNKPDVLIIARGGGSIEDLWPFHEEMVVRSVVESTIPIVSAVGHETDVTLIDYAADKRASTPTAAAEMVVPVRSELIERLRGVSIRKCDGMIRLFEHKKLLLSVLLRGLPSTTSLIQGNAKRLDKLTNRLIYAIRQFTATRAQKLDLLFASINHPTYSMVLYREKVTSCYEKIGFLARLNIEKSGQHLELSCRLLANLDYQKVLRRGYVLVKACQDNGGCHYITNVQSVKKVNKVALKFYDGEYLIKL